MIPGPVDHTISTNTNTAKETYAYVDQTIPKNSPYVQQAVLIRKWKSTAAAHCLYVIFFIPFWVWRFIGWRNKTWHQFSDRQGYFLSNRRQRSLLTHRICFVLPYINERNIIFIMQSAMLCAIFTPRKKKKNIFTLPNSQNRVQRLTGVLKNICFSSMCIFYQFQKHINILCDFS